MFHSYYSHSLDQLAQQFSEILRSDASDPLKPTWVVVQNNEIKEWLSLKVAAHQGIAGNFRFIFPSEFLWTLYRLKREEVPRVLPSDLNAMQWLLFDLLTKETDLLGEVPFYDVSEDHPKKRFYFCSQLADNFDQYQVYRPAMMEKWLKGEYTSKNINERWQAIIWRRLNKIGFSAPGLEDIPRRSQAFIELIDWMDDGDAFLDNIPGRVFVFGLSHVPQPFMQIICELSKHKYVHFFGRKTANVQGDSGLDSLYDNWKKPETERDSLLDQILGNRKLKFTEEVIEVSDPAHKPSIEVHSCHNKLREIQVLKDRVLEYFDENPDSKPHDVLVMVPDAESYSGMLETVFGADKGEPAIPVSRVSIGSVESYEYVLSELLELISSSFKATSVLQFMQLDPIKAHFSFSDADLNLIEQWVVENKIHQQIGDDFNSQYSWQKGLNQLLSGFIMHSDSLQVFEGLAPSHQVSSSDDGALTAKLSRFVHLLKQASEEISGSEKTPDQWLDFTRRLVYNFFGESTSRAGEYVRLTKLLNKLKEQAAYSAMEDGVSFNLIKSWLSGQLESQNSGSGRFGQGVTVSSYVPYRSVPFKFIAVLGMNEGVFPRKAVRPEFDLIYADPRPGDRVLKEDDTYLFLETMQAARDHLYLSYQGQDQRSDSIRLPSILIQQLLDVLHEDPEKGINRHSLHPFNKRYFSDEGPVSFSIKNLALAKQTSGDVIGSESLFMDDSLDLKTDELITGININDLIKYFGHPSKYLLENKLNIGNYDTFNSIEDRESFKLKGLERYKLDDLLFRSLTNKESVDRVYEYAVASSMIPEKLQGEKAF
ncbi:MAG TPA: exodeoxyribonuclease V subunit gamma, partial [Gracilimonas sp.]|uniref:exodeoxyribonuclease V subunit gamma n=1 Tax=Gracilimonas sp. TaxID=1974203 RepID=UPI002DA61D25|nr:exodeoxyribonuclease V subunit gamma [Gracilimonas sp.]